jgi:hypothetical protein
LQINNLIFVSWENRLKEELKYNWDIFDCQMGNTEDMIFKGLEKDVVI